MLELELSEDEKKQFWAECFNFAATTSNPIPFRHKGETNKDLSPYERFHGDRMKPKWLRHLRPFGEVAHVTNRKSIKGKIDP